MTETSQLAFLRLLQLLDSQFPTGGFAHSNGLESYAQAGLDKEQLEQLLRVQLSYGFGRLDLAACVLAFEAEYAEVRVRLSAELSAWKPIKGPRETSLKLGKRLTRLAHRLFPSVLLDWPEPHQALILGDLGRQLGIERRALILAYAQNTLLAQLQAATRCMALSPEQAQEIVLALQPLIVTRVEDVIACPEVNMVAATPALDVRAEQQARLYSRLFQS